MDNFLKKYNALGEIGLDLFLLNIYWVIFALKGGIILGIFPSTIALYSCVRQKMKYGYYEETSWILFKKVYKKEFFKANKLSILAFIWIFIYVDSRLLDVYHFGLISDILSVVLMIFTVILLLFTIYIFPVYVHFKGNLKEYVLKCLVLIIGKPLQSILLLLSLIFLFGLYYTFPGFIPVFGLSIYTYITFRILIKTVLFF
ncbi:YesL family protein [Alkalibacterium pelagium]|uniref:Uncharacterized membrane protein YesL n=1 Tax=Alkalibacterium pelagium TaxID=426702 RepID=A0A1H7HB93_9LACT|nr:DUF624 domain-containing protein [Alkalibacterium pelagium]GEN51720.1 hypothetical protein APE02nite_23850 [Alkalibacterium pelagium]SEK47509.1 Uncharacterized membrane protein YesL [Alkalibacterium pelagium]